MATIAQSAARLGQKQIASKVIKSPLMTSAPPSGAPAPIGNPWDSDPILLQIQAQQQQIQATSEAQAVAQKKQAEIAFGYDPNVKYEDQNTADAAKQNPFSTLANLLHSHELNQTNLNESYNKANLFYSGHRAQGLGEENRSYLNAQSQANQGLAGTMNSIAANLLNSQQNSQAAVTAAQGTAYQNYLTNALANQQYVPPAPKPAIKKITNSSMLKGY